MSQSAPYPEDEVQRLQALSFYQVLDTPPELAFDDLTFLASHICHQPNEWVQLETYIKDRSQAKFTHGICPSCKQEVLSQLGKA
jgi:hypothetical protein